MTRDLVLTRCSAKSSGYGYQKPDYTKVFDGDKPILCVQCGVSSGSKRQMLKCDFCNAYWHLDCVDPPLANPHTSALKHHNAMPGGVHATLSMTFAVDYCFKTISTGHMMMLRWVMPRLPESHVRSGDARTLRLLNPLSHAACATTG